MATNITATMTDAGNGLGGFLTAIQEPVVAFVIVFAIIGIMVAIGIAIGKAIERKIK